MRWLGSDTTVFLVKTVDLLHLRVLDVHAAVTAEVFLFSLAEPELTEPPALAPAKCPPGPASECGVGTGHRPVSWGWDVVCLVLAALPAAARLGAVCESAASLRSAWHSAYRFPSP